MFFEKKIGFCKLLMQHNAWPAAALLVQPGEYSIFQQAPNGSRRHVSCRNNLLLNNFILKIRIRFSCYNFRIVLKFSTMIFCATISDFLRDGHINSICV